MKKIFLLFCLFTISISGKGWAQTDFVANQPDSSGYRNIIHAELLGNTTAGISVNYTRLFPLKTTLPITIALRAGIGKVVSFNLGKADNSSYVAFPTEISIFAGRKGIMPEVGVGITFIDDVGDYPLGVPQDKTQKLLITSLGVRLQEKGSRFFMKGGLTFGLMDVSADAAESSLGFKVFLPEISLGGSF
jgi:hypothetical protein